MWGHIEKLTPDIGILRIFADGHRYGESWLWGCVVYRWWDTSLSWRTELKLVQKAPTPEMWRTVGHVVHETYGATKVFYKRGDGRRTTLIRENGKWRIQK